MWLTTKTPVTSSLSAEFPRQRDGPVLREEGRALEEDRRLDPRRLTIPGQILINCYYRLLFHYRPKGGKITTARLPGTCSVVCWLTDKGAGPLPINLSPSNPSIVPDEPGRLGLGVRGPLPPGGRPAHRRLGRRLVRIRQHRPQFHEKGLPPSSLLLNLASSSKKCWD